MLTNILTVVILLAFAVFVIYTESLRTKKYEQDQRKDKSAK